MSCNKCEELELELLSEDEEFEMDVDFKGEVINVGGITEETDPTVPEWAKQPEPPTIPVDRIYNPTSENAQSGIAVNEAFEIFKEQYQQIKNVTLQEISYMALLEQLKTFGAIRFNTGGQDFTGSSTDLNLPRGEYLAFYNGASSYCLELTSAIAYRFSEHDLFDTGEYTFSVSSPLWEAQTNISKVFRSLGDIDTALDNIIAIQNSYIGGVSE
jgi:hypothetical protein